jgi:heme-degrading monooxygenase HmoA
MVSRLELQRLRDVPSFLVHALRLRKATMRADGAGGLALTASPLRRTFWTLSSWESEAALRAFVRHPEHLATMRAFDGRMAGSKFVTWSTTERPTWADGMRRLDNDSMIPAP